MDNKVIAMVGAVIVVGAAVYGVATGTVLPGTEDISQDPSEEPADNGDNGGNDASSSNNGNGDDGDGDGGGSTVDNDGNVDDVLNDTASNDTIEDDIEVAERNPSYICEEQGGEVDPEIIPVRGGPRFNALLFESMLHNEFNELRQVRSSAEPLECDPQLREIAREHSRRMVEGGGISSPSARYAGVCENPSERYGRWYYQRDMQLNSPGKSNDQRIVFVRDHEELVRDVRGVWVNNKGLVGTLKNSEYTRQGVGAHIDRRTREVVVTHVVCGNGTDSTGSE